MEQIALFPKHTLRNHGRCLAALLRASVETVETGKGLCKKKKSKRRGTAHKVQSKRKHGFSTASTMVGAHIEYYANLRTLAFPTGRCAFNPKWTASTYQETLAHCSQRWSKRYRDLILETQHHHVVARLESPTHLEYLNFHKITPELLKTRISKLKSLVHGSQRNAMQQDRNANIRKRDELHAEGDLGKLIRLISGKPTEGLDLQTLPSEEEGLIIDHHRIQHKVISYFKDWHCIPKTLDPAADHLAKHPLWWQSLLKKGDTDKILNKKSNIPEDLQKGLRKNCEKKVSPAVEAKVKAAEDTPITFADFELALKDIVNGGAPGPSMATANMVKG